MGVVSLRDPNGKAVFNPTAYEIWFDEGDNIYSVKIGQTMEIK